MDTRCAPHATAILTTRLGPSVLSDAAQLEVVVASTSDGLAIGVPGVVADAR